MKRLGDVIHESRLTKGLTMRQLAEKINVTSVFISDIENHKKFPVNGDALKKLASFFKLDYEDLIKLSKQSKIIKMSESNCGADNLKMALARSIMNSGSIDETKVKEIMRILNEDDK